MKKNIWKKGITVLMVLVLAGCSFMMGGCGKAESAQSITVFNYGMYIDPEILESFEKETGIRVKYEEATTPEELYTKYTSGAITYDLLCTSDYMIQRMIKEDRLKPIDFSSMENVSKNIGDRYWDFCKIFDPENKYALPYFWGTVGILYDSTRIKGPVDSWDVLFNGEYSGEIIMQNSMRDAYMIALKYLGYSQNTTNQDEIKEAHALLMKQKPDVQAYLVDEVRDEIVAGNAIMGVIYSGEAYQGWIYNNDLEYVVPKEGSNIWIDTWVMTKECQNEENAKKFLDYLCREDIGMQNFEYVSYSSPNEAVNANMDEEYKSFVSIAPSEDITKNCEVNTQIEPEIVSLYNELWKELKAD